MITKYMAIGMVVLVALLGVSGWLLKRSYAANGALEVKLASANAIIAQREEDMRVSALEIARLAGRVQQIEETAAPVRERIIHVAATKVCPPVVTIDAAGWVRGALAPTGGPPAGRQPSAPLQPAGAPAK